MVVILVVSFGLVIWRLPLLKARNDLDSWMSREAAFLVNNWILLFSAFFVLFGTMFPTLSEALTGNRLTVAGPFFNKWMAPIALILLFLTGVGPLLAWRKSTLKNLVYQFMWPTIAFVGTAAALARTRHSASGHPASASRCARSSTARSPRSSSAARTSGAGTPAPTSSPRSSASSAATSDGTAATSSHLGFVLILLGFGGMGFNRETQVPLKAGEDVTIGRYTLRNTSLKVSDDGQKQMVTAYLAVFADGKQIDTLYPAKWFFRKHEQEPTTEVAIRRTLAEDLVRHARRLRSGDTGREPGDPRQSAGQLGVDGFRHPGVRHRHRAAARAHVLLRAGADAD